MNQENVEWKSINEILIPGQKQTLKKSQLKGDGKYPVINSGRTLYGKFNSYNNDDEIITFASRGEYAGFVSYFNEKVFCGGLCYPYKVKNKKDLNIKYVFYYLKSNEQRIMNEIVIEGSIPALNKIDIEKFKIPIPPFETQNKIVNILDKFSNIIKDIKNGIPKEIELTRKQYLYYRNKLLSFRE